MNNQEQKTATLKDISAENRSLCVEVMNLSREINKEINGSLSSESIQPQDEMKVDSLTLAMLEQGNFLRAALQQLIDIKRTIG